jgi:hypothetical protein
MPVSACPLGANSGSRRSPAGSLPSFPAVVESARADPPTRESLKGRFGARFARASLRKTAAGRRSAAGRLVHDLLGQAAVYEDARPRDVRRLR